MSEINMSNIYLTRPSPNLKLPYIEMLNEWEKTGERIIPWVLRLDYTDFDKLVEKLNAISSAVTAALPRSDIYWLMHGDGKMLGTVNIGHRLSDGLFGFGGHVGYGIRPSQRSRGYGTALLRLSLLELRKAGVENVSVTCAADNKASERVILKNGGVFDSEVLCDGVPTKRFWINNR